MVLLSWCRRLRPGTEEQTQQELAQQQGEEAAIGQAEALPGTEEDEDDVQEESEEEEEEGLYDEWCEELMQPGLPPNKKAKVDPAEAKAMPKVKAEPKASPKPSPKAKAKGKAKADAKGEAKGKAKAKAKPDAAQPKGKAKAVAKGKGKAKAKAAPAPDDGPGGVAQADGSAGTGTAVAVPAAPVWRDRCKKNKFNQIFDSLDKDIQSHYLGLKQGGPGKRGELTEFLNSIIKRTDDGKLQVDVDYAVKTRMVRNMGHEVKSGTKAYIKAQALAKVGGEAALNEALRVGDVKMGMMNGQMFYLFPTATFEAKETLGMDVGCSGENIIDQQLFEEMKASQFGYSGQLDGCSMPALKGTSSNFGLIGGLPALSDGSSSTMASAMPAMPAMPVPVDPVSDEALEQLKAAIKRKDKTEVYAMSLLKLSRSKASEAMMSDQLPKLEKSLEDLDLVASQCLNGMKFGKCTMPGGWNDANVAVLTENLVTQVSAVDVHCKLVKVVFDSLSK